MRALPGYLVILFFVFAARPTQSHRRPQISHQRRRRKERQRNAPAQSLEQEINFEVAEAGNGKASLTEVNKELQPDFEHLGLARSPGAVDAGPSGCIRPEVESAALSYAGDPKVN
jgi:hypothetical protein